MTTTITTTEVQSVLSDYKIHLTGEQSTSSQQESESTASFQNPPDWPTDRRRVPDFRPIDYTRTSEERPNGSNAFERAFLTIMFTGVATNAVRCYDSIDIC